VISDEPAISVAFSDAMESFRATWLWTHMPRPYDNTKAILLPKGERRSQRVALALREAGVVDLGAYLEELSCSGKAIYQH
jgi:rhodanese-related sulfurtransferase